MKLFIATALLLVSATAYGQVMKCISSDGRVEYASRCPAGTEERQTTISNKAAGGKSSPAAPAAAQKSIAEQNAAYNKRQTEKRESEQKAQKLAAEQAQKNQACDSARNYLKMLESGERLRVRDPQTGQIGYIDDAGRQAEFAKAQKGVADNCR